MMRLGFKHAVYALVALALAVSWSGTPTWLLVALIAYAVVRFVMLAFEGFACMNCWIQLALALMMLAFALVRMPPHAYVAAVLIILSDVLLDAVRKPAHGHA